MPDGTYTFILLKNKDIYTVAKTQAINVFNKFVKAIPAEGKQEIVDMFENAEDM